MKRQIQLILLVHSALTWTFLSAQNPGGGSVGLKPLPELGSSLYQGYQGGLYPGGTNVRPPQHDSAGRATAQNVVPLDSLGVADAAKGRIVLLSIGMSNTTQEFSEFKRTADVDISKNPRLTIVDGAQGGQTAQIISNPAASFWTVIDQRLRSAGVSRQQVQVAWVKEADAGPTTGFPTYARTLSTELETIVRTLKSYYPNIRIAYLSSRIYAGYATTPLNPEPYAYESGFSVKWLVEKQINADTSLAHAQPKPRAPWLAWGPYLWGDGLTPRASDGLIWQAADYQTDGTHPSPNGQRKVAALLLNFFKSDPTATPWFLKSGVTGFGPVRSSAVPRFSLSQNYPNPFSAAGGSAFRGNPGTAISFRLSAVSVVKLAVYDILGREVAALVNDMRPAGEHTVRWNAAGIPNGVYICRLTASEVGVPNGGIPENATDLVEMRRMLLLK
jgi:hypothetical protein